MGSTRLVNCTYRNEVPMSPSGSIDPPQPEDWHRFEIAVEHGPEGTRVCVVGELDIASAPKLLRVLDRLADNGHDHMLLDLTGVPFIDTRGVEAIAQARRSANEHGSRLTIRHRSRQVGRLLDVTSMASYLNSDLVLARE